MAERVTVATATTPVPIAVAFMPDAIHTADPLTALQLRVLPAAVKAGPAVKPMAVTLAGAYDSPHSNAVGWLPAVALKERLRETDPP